MKGLIKFAFGAVAVVLLVFVVLTVVVLMVFDPDDYQQLMVDAVYEQTGRTLTIDGGISLDTLPCCGVEVERGRLSNPADFPEGDFARIESIRLGLRLWPLLVDQEIIIGDIGLDGLELALIRREDGSASWDFPTSETSEPVESAPAEATPLPPLSAGGLTITDARITYQDQMTGASYRLDDFDLQTGAVNVGQPVSIGMQFQATDVTNEMSLQGELNLKVAVDFDTMIVAVEDVDADISVSGPALPSDGVTISAQTEAIEFDINRMFVAIENVNADFSIEGGVVPTGGVTVSTQTEAVDFDINSGNLALRNQRATVTAAGATVTINAGGTVADGAPDLSGTLSLAPLSPRELLRALDQPDIETSDPEALSNLQVSANWAMGKELLAIDELNLRLDDTTIEGRLQINYLDQSGLNFDFVGDQLAIDRYLAPAQEAVTPQAASGESGQSSESTEVPVETVRGLDFSGRVRLGRLTMDALLLENLHAEINASGGRVRLEPMTADLYGGKYGGAVTIDTAGETPSVKFRQTVADVQALGLLTDLVDTKNIEGVLSTSFTGQGVGRTDKEIISTLAGDLSFNLVDGVYKDVDVWYEIRKARALLKGESGPQKSADPQTPIEVLTITGRIDDGVLRTKSMVAEIPFLQLTGDGLFNMVVENMNFRFKASVHEKPVFADGEDLAGLQGLMIPLTVTGEVDSPSIGVDLGELAKSEAVKKGEEMLLDKLGLTKKDEEGEESGQSKSDDARDALKKGLRGLFGR